MQLKAHQIPTPLGPMTAVCSDTALHSLTFQPSPLPEGRTPITSLIEQELTLYFKQKLRTFTTPLFLEGTPLQLLVWQELQKIPYGTTCSYSHIALQLNRPTATRAVARANASNRHPIIIPCHRVIYKDGTLGGYNGGISKKTFLLHLETH